MFSYSTVAIVCLVPLILQAVIEAESQRICPTCAVKCSAKIGPLAWSIVNGQCHVFESGCALMSANCARQGKCMKATPKTTKKLCQPLCPICKTKKREIPVCATYRNATGGERSVTFISQCKLDRVACLRARPYSNVAEGACAKKNTTEQ